MTYVRASWEVIIEAEGKAHINLPHEHEAYLVHTFARWMSRPHIPTDAIAIKMLEAQNLCGNIKRDRLEEIAQECLLIQGLELNKLRWPSVSYYIDMAQLALGYRAYSLRPPELWYDQLAHDVPQMVTVLKHIGKL